MATVTDAEGKATAYVYNILGQRILTTYSDNGQQTIDSFDAAGRPLTITKPSGRKQHLSYDELGNVDQVQFKNAAGTVTETQTLTYDAYGRVLNTNSTQYGASTAKTYNSRGLLANESTTYSGQTYTVQYGYDGFGRLNKMTYPSGKVADYTFDDRHQLKTISWQSSQIESRSYNDVGQLTGVTRPFVNETRAYNAAGRVTSIGSPVSTMTYGYDPNGNVTSETLNNVMANYSFTTVSGGNTGYDGEDRFMRYVRSGVSEDIQLTRSHIGNISNVNRNGTNTARGYNNAHGLTTVSGGVTQTYDLDGNTTKLNTNVTASWDDAGRTMNTNTPAGATAGVAGFNEYGYVGGTRVWKKTNQNGTIVHRVYVHAGPNLIAEYNAGVGANSPAQEYVYADQIDSLVMIQRSNNQKLGVTRNRQWSVVGLHDLANGNVVERYAYDMTGKRTIYAANGTTVRTTSSFGNNFGYTNRWHDEESGLINFRARHYNPLTGEFLRRDPAGFVDGMSLYRGYMELGWMDPTGTVKIACGCRAGGNKGRPIETEVECKGSFETCCKEACRKAGRYTWDGQPSRIVYRPEFARSNNEPDIPSQNYVPGLGTYFSRYVFAWETPHPADPYDLALTRGKIVIGGAGAATLVVIGSVKAGVVGGIGHFGRSVWNWAWVNPATVDTTGKVTVGVLGGLAGVQDPLPDATDMGMAAKPIREVAEELVETVDDFARAILARDAAGRALSGGPNRSHAAYVGVYREGEVLVGKSLPNKIHAEDVAQQLLPGGQMTTVMGWRRNKNTGELEWTEIPICTTCQSKYPPELFPPGTKCDPGGSWK